MREVPPTRVSVLRAQGFGRSDIDRLLPRQFWGIRGGEIDYSTAARCTEFLPRIPPGGYYSHLTAAALWGVPLAPQFASGTDLHISVPRGRRAPDCAQVVGHQVVMRPEDVVVRDAIPLSSPARTWRDLASLLRREELIAAGDALVSRLRPLTTIEELEGVMLRETVYPGRRLARSALPRVVVEAESRPESLLRTALIDAGLPIPLVNPDILGARGEFVARVDLLFPDQRVVVEYDGDQHRTSATQWRRDVARLGALDDLGYRMVRATADDLPGFPRTVSRCRAQLARR